MFGNADRKSHQEDRMKKAYEEKETEETVSPWGEDNKAQE